MVFILNLDAFVLTELAQSCLHSNGDLDWLGDDLPNLNANPYINVTTMRTIPFKINFKMELFFINKSNKYPGLTFMIIYILNKNRKELKEHEIKTTAILIFHIYLKSK